MSVDESFLATATPLEAPIRRAPRELLRVAIEDVPRGSLVAPDESLEIEVTESIRPAETTESAEFSVTDLDLVSEHIDAEEIIVDATSSLPPASLDDAAPLEIHVSIAPSALSSLPPGSAIPGAPALPRVSIPPPPPLDAIRAAAGGMIDEEDDDGDPVIDTSDEIHESTEGKNLETLEADHEHDLEEMDDTDFVEDARTTDAPPASAALAPPTAPPAAPPPTPPAAAAQPPAVPAAPKKKADWFDTFFNEDYLRTVRQPNAKSIARQCEFIDKLLGLPAGSNLLDVGCGLGFQANELARRGHHLVAVDTSKTMITRAAEDATDYGVDVRYLQADMREMTFDVGFDAVLSLGTTFGYFDEETNRKVLRRMYDALREGGRLLLDVVNRDFVIRNQPNLVWFEGDGCICMEETQFNAHTSTLEVSRNVMLDEGRQRETSYSVRLYALHELQRELEAIGFRLLSVSGSLSTPGVFFGADAPRMIILAERNSSSTKSAPAPSVPSFPG